MSWTPKVGMFVRRTNDVAPKYRKIVKGDIHKIAVVLSPKNFYVKDKTGTMYPTLSCNWEPVVETKPKIDKEYEDLYT